MSANPVRYTPLTWAEARLLALSWAIQRAWVVGDYVLVPLWGFFALWTIWSIWEDTNTGRHPWS